MFSGSIGDKNRVELDTWVIEFTHTTHTCTYTHALTRLPYPFHTPLSASIYTTPTLLSPPSLTLSPPHALYCLWHHHTFTCPQSRPAPSTPVDESLYIDMTFITEAPYSETDFTDSLLFLFILSRILSGFLRFTNEVNVRG